MPCLGGASKKQGLLEVTFSLCRRVWHIPRQRFIYFVIKKFQGQGLTKQTDVSSAVLGSWGRVFCGELCCPPRTREADRSLLCSWEKRESSLSFSFLTLTEIHRFSKPHFVWFWWNLNLIPYLKALYFFEEGVVTHTQNSYCFCVALKANYYFIRFMRKYSYQFFPSLW